MTTEERALADRLSGYGDAVAAFSLVNAFGFLVAIAEIDTRCSLTESRTLVLATVCFIQMLYGAAVFGLRRVEISMREGSESSQRVNDFRRNFYRGRLFFIAFVTLSMTGISWIALGSDGCSPS